MAKWWWNNPKAWEGLSFKRVPEGWIYASPIRWWPVGRQKYVLLTDAQKNEVSDILDRWKWQQAALMLLLMAPLLWCLLTFPNLMSDLLSLLAVLAVNTVCAQPLSGAFYWLILRKALANAQPTSERITFRERFAVLARLTPQALLIFYAVFLVGLIVFLGYVAFRKNLWDPSFVTTIVILAVPAAATIAALLAKRRFRQPTGAP